MSTRLKIDLTGKVALIIGGSRGIGGAITYVLANAGADGIFTHTGNPEYKEALSLFEKKIRLENLKAEGQILGATDYEKTRSLVSKIISRKGHIDILVYNAGFSRPATVEEKDIDEWGKMIDINLGGAFYNVKAVLPEMVKRNYGRIVFIGSSAVFDGGGGAIDYASSKSGLTGMCLYLARNYASKGINTNIIHPAVIETDMLKIRYKTKEDLEKLRQQIPVGRLGKPEDIGYLVAFLVSSLGDYICGQAILVDGGRTFFGKT